MDDNISPTCGLQGTSQSSNLNLTPAQRQAMVQALFSQSQAPASSGTYNTTGQTSLQSPLSLIVSALNGNDAYQKKQQAQQYLNQLTTQNAPPIQTPQQQAQQAAPQNQSYDPSVAQNMSDGQIMQMIQGGMSGASQMSDPTQP